MRLERLELDGERAVLTGAACLTGHLAVAAVCVAQGDLRPLAARPCSLRVRLACTDSELDGSLSFSGAQDFRFDARVRHRQVPGELLALTVTPEGATATFGDHAPWVFRIHEPLQCGLSGMLPPLLVGWTAPGGWGPVYRATQERWASWGYSSRGRGWIRPGLEAWAAFTRAEEGPPGTPGPLSGLVELGDPPHGWLSPAPRELSWRFDALTAPGAGEVPELVEVSAADAPVLRQMAEVLDARDVRLSFPRTLRDDTVYVFHGARVAVVRRAGRVDPEEALTDDERWALAFVWYAAANVEGPVIATFPETLPPSLAAACAAVVGERQWIRVEGWPTG